MAFKEKQGQGDSTIKLGGRDTKTGKNNPTSVEGYYLGSRSVTVNGGDSLIHQFQTEKGNIDVWGKTDLDRKLNGIPEGTMVRATFTGTRPIPGKPQPMYVFKVEADDENVLGLTAPNNVNAEFGNQSGLDEEETDVDDDSRADEAPVHRPAKNYGVKASPTAQKAKELLAKRG